MVSSIAVVACGHGMATGSSMVEEGMSTGNSFVERGSNLLGSLLF